MFDSSTESNLPWSAAEMKKEEKKNTDVSNLIECHCHLMLWRLNLEKEDMEREEDQLWSAQKLWKKLTS